MSISQHRIASPRHHRHGPRTTLVAALLLASAGLSACGQQEAPETLPSPPAPTASTSPAPAVPAGLPYQDDDRLLKDLSRARLQADRLQQQQRELWESCVDGATYGQIITTRVSEQLADSRCPERHIPIPGRYAPRAE